MKNSYNSLVRNFVILFIIFAGFILPENPAFSQSKLELSGGLGAPEYIHTRIKYGQKVQLGICAGFIAGTFYTHAFFNGSISAEITWHFLGKSKFVDQTPWYILGGLGYYYLPMSAKYGEYDVGFFPRIGRTINFSKRTGINLDLGIFLPIAKANDSSMNELAYKILGSWSISYFIRLR